MWKTDFYCEKCEYNNLVSISVSTEGFEVECPQCGAIWWFSAEETEPLKEEENNA